VEWCRSRWEEEAIIRPERLEQVKKALEVKDAS